MARILVLDDELFTRETISALIRSRGHEVTGLGDAGSTLDLLEREPGIDAVVTDLVMPGIDGLEFIRTARRHHPGLPIVAISGNGPRAGGSYLSAAKLLGADVTLEKPRMTTELLPALDEVLARATRARLGAAATIRQLRPPGIRTLP